ncbi:MAG TPA: two-component regulator propeller domain-containing protein [Pyrinomonadaceae bacterium]|nr:hypothetical protein [Chloracidobacterium sp.]HRK49655.1 two-component regulator propeller domain-containing protein [Pyrinomonadaceae bacterium]
MRVSTRLTIFTALFVFHLLIAFAFAGFFAQEPQTSPSPSPSPEASPSVSPSPTPTRSPSPTPLPGAQNFHQWGSITVFNGLPSDSVRAIGQTSDGVMWFGTDNGLARFDGRRIEKFSLGGADADRVLALKTSPIGELWVGTRAGVFVYSDGSFQPVEGTNGLSITAMLVGPEVYVGTDDGHVLRVRHGESGAYFTEKVFAEPIRGANGSPLAITSIIEIDGKLFLGTSGRGVFVVKDGAVAEFAASPRPLFVNSLARSDTGELWFGTNAAKGVSGIFLADGTRATRIAAPTANVLSLEANDSGVWAGTERYGLFHIADSKLKKTYTFENTSGGLRSNNIFTLFTDREGVLWIGTNRGLSRFDRSGASQETVSDSPNSNFVRSLFYIQTKNGNAELKTLLAGTNRGLFDFNGKKWNEMQQFRGRSIYAIDTSAKNPDSIIVGTPEGIFDLVGSSLIKGDTRAISYYQGRLYAAVYGRGVFDISEPAKLIFANETVTSLGGNADKMWIGTANSGLFGFDKGGATLEISPEVLGSGAIWKIWQAGFQTPIWIAGQHGLFVLREKIPEKVIDAEDVRDVWVSDPDTNENVWAATTTRGLLHARRDKRFGWIVSSLGFEQGLPSEKAFAILPTRDGLLIATNRGVVTYKPGTVAPKLIPTRILSQRVHELSEIRSTIALDYPQNSLVVEVAGQSSRTFPEEFQYGFVLTDANGKEIDRRISNDEQYAPAELAPGEYTIESIAFNRDLLPSEPLAIRFSVAKAPFPWTASALGVLLAIAVLGLIWAIIEHRRIQQRNLELAAARLDLANEAERERRRIARDLHDQTLADLRNLMMLTDKTLPDNPEFRTEIEAVSSEIRRICEDLSPSVLENVGLIASLEFLLDSTIENRQFNAESNLEDRINLPMNVQLQIYRIAQEVLTNVKSHSDADHVEMSVEINADGQLKLRIDDNGTTFNPDAATAKGRGIANIKARASLVNAKVAWKESKGGGNRFAMSIKV